MGTTLLRFISSRLQQTMMEANPQCGFFFIYLMLKTSRDFLQKSK